MKWLVRVTYTNGITVEDTITASNDTVALWLSGYMAGQNNVCQSVDNVSVYLDLNKTGIAQSTEVPSGRRSVESYNLADRPSRRASIPSLVALTTR